jgi:hypothetical protein
MNYYIYVYLDPRKQGQFFHEPLTATFLYEPFYIGKGKKDRRYAHLQDSSLKRINLKNNMIRHLFSLGYTKETLKTYVLIIKDNLTEQEAFEYECRYIDSIGRKDLGTGSLCNHSDGGEGSSGVFKSEETRAKIREKRKLQVMPPCSEEKKKKISDKNKVHLAKRKGKSLEEIYGVEKSSKIFEKLNSGKPRKHKGIARTEIDKQKIKNGQNNISKGASHYRTYTLYITTPNDISFCYLNGVFNFYTEYKLPKKQVYKMLKDSSYSYKGWKISRVTG